MACLGRAWAADLSIWDPKSHRLWRPWTQIQADQDSHSCRAIALHVVSILCHVCQQLASSPGPSPPNASWGRPDEASQQLIATGHSLAREPHSCLCYTVSVSSKSLSISIAFLAAPRAVEQTVIDDELCPPLQPYFSLVYTWFNVYAILY